MLRIVPDGINYACGLSLAGVIVSYFVNPYVGIPLYVLALFCLWFFRDPERSIPTGDVMVSPADGKVLSVKETEQGQRRLSIFLNVFNVHVARSPVGGELASVTYAKGRFHVASLESASLENEKSTLVIQTEVQPVTFSLVAGLVARRIVTYKAAGEAVARGERIGIMKFGSRVDLWIGPEWELMVRSGQKVAAGTTVVARWKPQPGAE